MGDSESADRLTLQNAASVVYCRCPIVEGRVDDARTGLANALREAAEPERLLGFGRRGDGREPYTLSVFLETTDDRSFLIWHVEGQWPDDDGSVVVESAPVFETIEPTLETEAMTVLEPSTFVRHPDRPRTVTRRTDGIPFVLGTEGEKRVPLDVVLFRPKIRSGLPETAMTWFQRSMDWFADDGWVERAVDGWTEPVIEDEGVYTETAFLERVDGDWHYVNYLECEDRERVWRAFHESDTLLTRVSEWVLRRTLEEPSFLDRLPEPEFELLVHAVNERRP